MTWTQAIADSLGVADEGLRLILGQLSGKTFKKSDIEKKFETCQFVCLFGTQMNIKLEFYI